jgi:hypothetical protein
MKKSSTPRFRWLAGLAVVVCVGIGVSAPVATAAVAGGHVTSSDVCNGLPWEDGCS